MIWNFPRFFRVFSPAGGIFRNFEPVWCPHSFLCLLFPGKGKRTAFSFCFSKKKTPGKRKETGENFRMVSPDPFSRPEPCSGLAAYGSRRIYDRLCRDRCRAQLFATKERYRCGLPLAGTHRPLRQYKFAEGYCVSDAHSAHYGCVSRYCARMPAAQAQSFGQGRFL